jgi:hypothetical protein
MVVDKRGIERLMSQIQREFDKHPIRVPIEAEADLPTPGGTHYHAPVVVVHGDNAQVAWDNETVTQTQNSGDQIAPGFELIATAVANALQALPALGLSESDSQQVDETAREMLAEVTKAEPDRRFVQRSVNALKGLVSSAALGVQQGATEESKALAIQLFDQLGQSF